MMSSRLAPARFSSPLRWQSVGQRIHTALWCAICGVAVLVEPAPVWAKTRTTHSFQTAPPQVTRRPPAAGNQLERRFKEAVALHSASNYLAAIAAFSDALTLWEAHSDDRVIRGAILFNLANSYERAAEIEQSPRYLRLARDTYLRYLREASEGFPYDAVERVKARLAAIDEQLAKAPLENPSAIEPQIPPASEQTLKPLESTPPVSSEQRPADAVAPFPATHRNLAPTLKSDTTLTTPSLATDKRFELSPAMQRSSHRLRISGGILVGLGVALSGVGLGASIVGEKLEQSIRHNKTTWDENGEKGTFSNVLAYTGWSSGIALTGIGTTLLIYDRVRLKRARAMQIGFDVHIQPQAASFTLQGRF